MIYNAIILTQTFFTTETMKQDKAHIKFYDTLSNYNIIEIKLICYYKNCFLLCIDRETKKFFLPTGKISIYNNVDTILFDIANRHTGTTTLSYIKINNYSISKNNKTIFGSVFLVDIDNFNEGVSSNISDLYLSSHLPKINDFLEPKIDPTIIHKNCKFCVFKIL